MKRFTSFVDFIFVSVIMLIGVFLPGIAVAQTVEEALGKFPARILFAVVLAVMIIAIITIRWLKKRGIKATPANIAEYADDALEEKGEDLKEKAEEVLDKADELKERAEGALSDFKKDDA